MWICAVLFYNLTLLLPTGLIKGPSYLILLLLVTWLNVWVLDTSGFICSVCSKQRILVLLHFCFWHHVPTCWTRHWSQLQLIGCRPNIADISRKYVWNVHVDLNTPLALFGLPHRRTGFFGWSRQEQKQKLPLSLFCQSSKNKVDVTGMARRCLWSPFFTFLFLSFSVHAFIKS